MKNLPSHEVSDTSKMFVISVAAAIIAKLVDRVLDIWTQNKEGEVTNERRLQYR